MAEIYKRGPTPDAPALLPGFLRKEFEKIQRALANVSSGGGVEPTPFGEELLAAEDAAAARAVLELPDFTRGDVVLTTASLADLATEDGSVAIDALTAILLLIAADRACWVRLYTSSAARAADAARALGTTGTAGVGLLAEFVFASAETIPVSPVATLSNDEAPPQDRIWYAVQNRSGGTSAVEVTLTLLPLEISP